MDHEAEVGPGQFLLGAAHVAVAAGDVAMDAADLVRLRELTSLFIAKKEFSTAHELELTDAMTVAIAAQACLPVLNLSLDLHLLRFGLRLKLLDLQVHHLHLNQRVLLLLLGLLHLRLSLILL